jgi:hypothetical protein
MNPFSVAGDVLIASPFYALLPAGGLLLAWYVARSRLALVAGAIWLLYALYEQLVKARLLCSGECNIRIDLLAIYPVLLIVSVAAVVAIAARLSRRRAGR